MSRRHLAALVVSLTFGAVATAQAAPGGVAYLKDKQVWVAKLDGSKKVQLSAGDPWWNAVGQSSSGGIVATKNEPNKIFQFSTFTIWNPDGTEKDVGPASPGLNYSGSLAMPLGLELTADNRGLIYGFSHYVYGYPVGSLTTGYALLPSATRVTPASPGTFTNTTLEWPSLVAGRIIGSPDGHGMAVENAGGNNTGNFTAWTGPNLAVTGVPNGTVHRVQASDNGTLLALEIDIHDANNASADNARILIMKTTGLLGSYVDDCWLPVSGKAQFADVAADGSAVSWSDADGVKIAGPPAFGGEADCVLTRPPTLIDAGASYPALGPIDVDALYAARNPTTTTTTTTTTTNPVIPTTPTLKTPAANKPPAVAVPTGLTAATLAVGGTTLQVAVGKPGKVTVTVTVPAKTVGRKGAPVVIATGTASPKKAGQLAIKLKPTATGKKLKAKLRGKRVTVKVKSAGKTTSKTLKLS